MNQGAHSADKRTNERIAADFAVSLVEWAAGGGNGPVIEGRTVNVGSGGLSLTVEAPGPNARPLERGRKYRLEFRLPTAETPVCCAAQVAWVLQGKGDKGRATAGLMFLDLGPEDLEKISDYVEHRR